MTISASIRDDFHQGSCPLRDNNQNYQDCSNKQLAVVYRCSKCAASCLKCEASRLNTNFPYARGCNEARQVATRTFSCVCIRDCEG